MVYPLGFAENSIQLVPDGTLWLHVLIIIVMVYVLNATLFRPINRILEAREKRTRGRLTEAQEILSSVSEKLAEYERALRRARTEAYALAEHVFFQAEDGIRNDLVTGVQTCALPI